MRFKHLFLAGMTSLAPGFVLGPAFAAGQAEVQGAVAAPANPQGGASITAMSPLQNGTSAQNHAGSDRLVGGAGGEGVQPAPEEAINGFIVAGGASPEDWTFVMGPRNSSNMVLRLSRRLPEASVAFECRRKDGQATMAVLLNGVKAEAGDSLPIKITVGKQSHPTQFQAGETPKDEGGYASTPFSATGAVATDVLAAMAGVLGDNPTTLDIERGGKSGSFTLPYPSTITAVSARICAEWASPASAAASDRAP